MKQKCKVIFYALNPAKTAILLAKPFIWTVATIFSVFFLHSPLGVLGQISTIITPDATLPTNSRVTSIDNHVQIDAGTIIGTNQFHSFRQFNVGTNDIASFNGPKRIENILSRVTGGLPSEIDGTLQSTIDGANLYFLNPAGVVFGPNASLDLSGSFHVATAKELTFDNEAGFFSAVDPTSDILTSAPPSAFGFLPNSHFIEPITINTSLVLPDHQHLEVTGGDIIIRGGTLHAPGGTIELNGNHIDAKEHSTILSSTRNTNSGDITLRANKVSLTDGSKIFTETQVSGQGGTISITAPEVQINNGASISTSTEGSGQGGRVMITAENILTLSGVNDQSEQFESGISTHALGNGNAGDIILDASRFLINGHDAFVSTLTTGRGDAGIISLTAELIDVMDARIESRSTSQTTGAAGNITIHGVNRTNQLPSRITMNNGMINSEATGQGAGGNIVIAVDELGSVSLTDTTISASVKDRPPETNTITTSANITLTSPDIMIVGGTITGETTGSRDASNITFQAHVLEAHRAVGISSSNTGGPTSTGNAGHIAIEGFPRDKGTSPANLISFTDTRLATIAGAGGGTGGDITITTQDLILDSQLRNPESNGFLRPLAIVADSTGAGNAGNITFNVETLTGNIVFMSSRSRSTNPGAGNAGRITIQGLTGTGSAARTIAFLDNSRLSTEILPGNGKGDGQGGQIKVIASESIFLQGTNLIATVNNRDESDPGDTSVAGIEVVTKDLRVGVGGLKAATTGSRDAGNILAIVTGKATLIDDRAPKIEASTSSTGNAGNIVFQVRELEAINAEFVSLSENPLPDSGDAGQITIGGPGSSVASPTPVPGPVTFTNTKISTEVAFPQENTARLPFEGDGNGGMIHILSEENISLTNTIISATVHDDPINVGNPEKSPANVALSTPQLDMTEGRITAESTGTRNAGFIDLNVDKFQALPGPTQATISSSNTSPDAQAGDAGTITIRGYSRPGTGQIFLQDTNIITEATSGQGGSIVVHGSNMVTLNSTTVSAKVTSGGEGGNINFLKNSNDFKNTSPSRASLFLQNGTVISAENTGTGNAGSILLESTNTLRITDSSVSTEAAQASGGNIRLNADSTIQLVNSQLQSSVEGNALTQGGNIRLTSEFILAQNSQILAQANEGAGGNIDLIANVVLVETQNSIIDASSQLGISGNINIASPVQNLSEAIAKLPETIREVATLYNAQCAGNIKGLFSSLTINGQGQTIPTPGNYLPSPLLSNYLGYKTPAQVAHTSSVFSTTQLSLHSQIMNDLASSIPAHQFMSLTSNDCD